MYLIVVCCDLKIEKSMKPSHTGRYCPVADATGRTGRSDITEHRVRAV